MNNAKQLANQAVSAHQANSSVRALVVVQVDSTGGIISGSPGGGSTQVSVKEILTSSGASVMDSTNNAIGVTIRAGSAAGTEYTDGDTDATPSGGAIFFSNGTNTMRVVSSTLGLPVNVIAGSAAGSTIVTVSTGSVRVHQSSAGDLNVTVAGYVAPSTTVSVSTGSVRVHQSTAGDLLATVSQGGTWNIGTVTTVSSVAGILKNQLVDRDQSTQVAAVLNTDPASTTYGIAVRQVGAVTNSTIVSVSTGSVRVHQSSAGDLNVTVAGYVAPSTTVSVSTGSVRVHQSTAGDLLVTASQGGTWNVGTVTTITTVSSVAGVVKNQIVDRDSSTQVAAVLNDAPASTVWALAVRQVGGTPGSTTVNVSSVGGVVIVRSSAADLLGTVYQSTYTALNGLMRLADRDASTQVAAVLNGDPASTVWALAVRQVGNSTTVNVSSLAGTVQVHTLGNSTAADYIPVRIVDSSGTGFLTPSIDYTDGVAVSTLVGPALAFNNSSANTMRLVGSSTPLPTHLRTSSGADIGDSTERAIRVNVVAGAAGGSTEVTVRQSTYTDFNTLSRLADRDASTKVAAVLSDAAPASTAYGIVVRMPAPYADSTNNAIRVFTVASSGGAGSTEVTLSGIAASTTVQNSTRYLPVRFSNSTAFLDGAVEYTNGSTVSTLVGPALLYNNSSNDTMRLVGVTQPLPVQLRTGTLSYESTTQFITSTHSTALYSLVSSGARRVKVYAFHVTSTHTNPSTLVFMSSLGSDLWHVGFGSGSSGVTGANLAVTPPAFLFGTAVNEALNVRIEGGNSTAASTTLARISFSYFTE